MHRIHMRAAPEDVYHAIATAGGVRKWWTRDADLDEVVGGRGEFRFYGGTMITHVRIDELSPVERVRWTVTDSFAPGWKDTTLHFEITPGDGDTVLRFAQRGFPVADERFAMSTTGWGLYFLSMQQYLETGAGVPAPDLDFIHSRFRITA